jgi:hypothetical protein
MGLHFHRPKAAPATASASAIVGGQVEAKPVDICEERGLTSRFGRHLKRDRLDACSAFTHRLCGLDPSRHLNSVNNLLTFGQIAAGTRLNTGGRSFFFNQTRPLPRCGEDSQGALRQEDCARRCLALIHGQDETKRRISLKV